MLKVPKGTCLLKEKVLVNCLLYMACSVYFSLCSFYAPEGWHIVIDSSVRPSVSQCICPSVRSFFVRSITLKLCKAWNFIGRYISLRRKAVHKNHYSRHHTFGVVALCSFSFLNFVRSITQKVFKLLTSNFIGRYMSFRRSAVHKNYNSKLHIFGVFVL